MKTAKEMLKEEVQAGRMKNDDAIDLYQMYKEDIDCCGELEALHKLQQSIKDFSNE